METALTEPTRNSGMVDMKTLQSVEARLARIEGQIRGIRSMAAEGRECVDIVMQVAAVRAALKKVADMMVADHVERWLAQAASSDGGDRKRDVEELLKVFNQYYR
jgi:DNA-binding FrmR family transcriptional regulator